MTQRTAPVVLVSSTIGCATVTPSRSGSSLSTAGFGILFPVTSLAALGLAPGMAVRFRRAEGNRWRPAVVERVEKDGSLGLRDPKGAARAIPLAQVEVEAVGPRGGRTWESVIERALRSEQLALF
jgi:hypothetical protein